MWWLRLVVEGVLLAGISVGIYTWAAYGVGQELVAVLWFGVLPFNIYQVWEVSPVGPYPSQSRYTWYIFGTCMIYIAMFLNCLCHLTASDWYGVIAVLTH